MTPALIENVEFHLKILMMVLNEEVVSRFAVPVTCLKIMLHCKLNILIDWSIKNREIDDNVNVQIRTATNDSAVSGFDLFIN